jgi:hypothetical protein
MRLGPRGLRRLGELLVILVDAAGLLGSRPACLSQSSIWAVESRAMADQASSGSEYQSGPRIAHRRGREGARRTGVQAGDRAQARYHRLKQACETSTFCNENAFSSFHCPGAALNVTTAVVRRPVSSTLIPQTSKACAQPMTSERAAASCCQRIAFRRATQRFGCASGQMSLESLGIWTSKSMHPPDSCDAALRTAGADS